MVSHPFRVGNGSSTRRTPSTRNPRVCRAEDGCKTARRNVRRLSRPNPLFRLADPPARAVPRVRQSLYHAAMFRIQLRRRRLGAVGVIVVASTLMWAPSASAAVQPSSQAVGVVPGPLIPFDPAKPNQNPCGRFPVPDYGINEPGESLPSLEID